MMRWPSSRTLAITLAVLVFAVCSLLPVASVLSAALSDQRLVAGAFRLDARQRGLLWNTVVLGTGSCVLATAVGAPLGMALARVPMRAKGPLRLALAIPMLMPPYIVALAWTYLDPFAEWTYSLPAAILVLGLLHYPVPMLATEVAMRRIDGRLEEAGLLVSPWTRVLSRITLPLVRSSILGAALLVFVLAISEFGVPGLLRVRVYTTEVFTAFAALYDASRAMLLAVPLLVVCAGVAIVAATLAADALVTSRRTSGVRALRLDRWRHAAEASALLVAALAVVLPLLVLGREAYSTRTFRPVLEGSAAAIVNSVRYSAAGATAVVAVAFVLGYARARATRRLGLFADALLVAAFAIPSTIVGVGLIGVWNRPGPLGAAYGTSAMFLLGYLARFVPMATLVLGATIRHVPVSHEEAAAVGGAGWARTLVRVVLPQSRAGLLAAWVIVFVLAFGELGVSILVAPPGDATLPIRIYTIIANTPTSHVAALALFQTFVILLPVASVAVALSLRERR